MTLIPLQIGPLSMLFDIAIVTRTADGSKRILVGNMSEEERLVTLRMPDGKSRVLKVESESTLVLEAVSEHGDCT